MQTQALRESFAGHDADSDKFLTRAEVTAMLRVKNLDVNDDYTVRLCSWLLLRAHVVSDDLCSVVTSRTCQGGAKCTKCTYVTL